MAKFMKYSVWTSVLAGWMLTAILSPAQIIVQQGIVKVSGLAPLTTVNTLLTNYGTITQQGALITESDLLNYGSYDATNSKLVLQGENQRVLSESLTVAQLHLKSNGTTTLEGNLEILESLLLEEGLLQVGEPSRLTLNEAATITQNTESSYVWGSVTRQGTGSKFFPVGTRNEYAPLTLTNVRGNNPLVRVQYAPVANQPYWSQTQLAGNYEGSSITVTFPSRNPDYEFYPEQLTISARASQEQTETILASDLAQLDLPRITISSTLPTALPWISVGFLTEEAEEEIYVPNAFSPEAPNPEDRVIKVYGRYLSHQNFYFGIQDVWGRWIYQTTSIEDALSTGLTSSQISSAPAQFRYVASGQILSGKPIQSSDTIIKF